MSVYLLVSFVEISEVGWERLVVSNKIPSPSLLRNKKQLVLKKWPFLANLILSS